jgi:hypothetical protein
MTVAGPEWEFVADHEKLQKKLIALYAGDDDGRLQCVRMMGTFVGAVTAPAVGRKRAPAATNPGLIDQTASLLFEQRRSARAMFLIGSDNRAMPMDQVPYRFYTYLFVTSVVRRMQKKLKEITKRNLAETRALASYRLVIRLTFVPEDILFAQFLFDDRHLFMAATYSWEAAKQVPEAYAALALDNSARHYGKTAQRLTEIFDARFRIEADALGEEVWTLRQAEGGSYVALVSTPFWQRGKSVLQPYDFSYRGPAQSIELGENSIEELRLHLWRMWGLDGAED